VTLVVNPEITEVSAGQTVALTVEASGQNLSFNWSVARGKLSASDKPAVIYTAPDSAGVDTVTVEVSSASGTTTRNVSFNVIVPPTTTFTPTPTLTFTPTPKPTDTPTNTPVWAPAPTDTPTNTPTPTCPPTATPKTLPPGYQSPHLDVVSITLRIGNTELVIDQQEQLVEMTSGDPLEVLEVTFNSPADGSPSDNVAGEAYVRKVGLCPDDFDWNDGRFAYGVPILAGNYPLRPFINVTGGSDAWTVEAGWNRLVIVLVHNFPAPGDGAVVDARFFVNLRVQ